MPATDGTDHSPLVEELPRVEEPAAAAGPEVPGDLLLLTVEQAARLLQLSRSNVYLLARSGRLRTIQLGGLRRVVRADLLAFVEELRAAADDPAELPPDRDRDHQHHDHGR